MGLADVTAMRETALEMPLGEQAGPGLRAALDRLDAQARAELASQGVPAERIRAVHRVHLRYDGTDTALVVPAGSPETMAKAFEEAYLRRFSFLMPDKPVTVEAVSVELIGASEPVGPGPASRPPRRARPVRSAAARVFTGGRWARVPLHHREELAAGGAVPGPAIIVEANATTVVEPGWTATLDTRNYLLLNRCGPAPARQAVGTGADPVRLEIFNNLFMSIAEQMGYRLQGTAHSVNVKERLDFSCAIFDAEGSLIVNAPHMPVHLGSMGESVKEVIAARRGTMKPGDAYMLNDPYHGGTHLPDITVITPVFSGDGEILFYVASRGHHAEIGGITPCSMPAFSARIEEEGVLIRNWLLVENGSLREAETREMLRGAPHPSPTRTRTSPTCAPRSPPTRRACGNCGPWSATTASTWSAPTWATCRTTPRNQSAGSSPSCRTARTPTSSTTGP